MIGNSFCYSYTEELFGIAKAANIDLTIYNIYEEGCAIAEHYNSLMGLTQPSKFTSYSLHKTTKDGFSTLTSGLSNLIECIQYPKVQYDIISLQEHFGVNQIPAYPDETIAEPTDPAKAKAIYDAIKALYPYAKYYWHETWAYEVGHPQSPNSLEEQIADQAYIRKTSNTVAALCGATIIPSGDAWEIARSNPLLGNTMHQWASGKNDLYHDGDIGGGQYLNACVWFETLFGLSCIGNTWRPGYTLTEEKIMAAQESAHEVCTKQ